MSIRFMPFRVIRNMNCVAFKREKKIGKNALNLAKSHLFVEKWPAHFYEGLQTGLIVCYTIRQNARMRTKQTNALNLFLLLPNWIIQKLREISCALTQFRQTVCWCNFYRIFRVSRPTAACSINKANVCARLPSFTCAGWSVGRSDASHFCIRHV